MLGPSNPTATGSLRFLRPSSSASVLSHTGSASVLGHSGSTSSARLRTLALVSRASGLTQANQLFICARGSSDIVSISVGRHPDVGGHLYTVAPPAVDSAVGCQNIPVTRQLPSSPPGSHPSPLTSPSPSTRPPPRSSLTSSVTA